MASDEKANIDAWSSAVLASLSALPHPTKADVQRIKLEKTREFSLHGVPRDSVLLARLPRGSPLASLLLVKPSRTASGVAVVAAMTSPCDCPHGQCVPCPGGMKQGVPQSYTGFEPAARRAIQNDFDPYKQASQRLKQLEEVGHETSKVDLIVMGGTFTAREKTYQSFFVKGLLDALNGRTLPSLEEAIAANAEAPHRCVGLTVETRPDQLSEEQARFAMSYGTTRVELGVQSIRDDTLRTIERGHGVQATVDATATAKRLGLKVCYHMMPGLPGMTLDDDGKDLLQLFSDPRFQPDSLKIYPTLVVPGSKLHEWWKEGRYSPPEADATAEMLARVKPMLPPYVRIQRIERDIPVDKIAAGIMRSDLRELVREKIDAHGQRCGCIRCREMGLGAGKDSDHEPDEALDSKPALRSISYEASGGTEHFLSFETPHRLHAYLRLRLDGNATVRELKTVGRSLAVGDSAEEGSAQHRGFGKALIREAERIAVDAGFESIRVTSAVGTRDYYRKLGYGLEAPFMARRL